MVSSFSLTASANSRFESSSSCSSSSSSSTVVVAVPSSGPLIPAHTLNSTLLALRCCIEFSSRAISALVQYTAVSATLAEGGPWRRDGRTFSQEFRFELTQLRERDGLSVPWRVVHYECSEAPPALSSRIGAQRVQSRSREVNRQELQSALHGSPSLGLQKGGIAKEICLQHKDGHCCLIQKGRGGESVRRKRRTPSKGSDGAHF